MQSIDGIGLNDVRDVYNGPEGALWELIMGEQIHIGGLSSSMKLAEKAGIAEGMSGIDLCCCNGAGMRFLVRLCKVARMQGVDATETVVNQGRERCAAEGLSDKIEFVEADVCCSGLPAAQADFIWGEDAWCYVKDKPGLIAEAVRLVRPGGTIAFTDWIEGNGLSKDEAGRFLSFMKFPNVLALDEYCRLLEESGCDIVTAEDSAQFAPHVDLYLQMLNMQLTYDALKIIGFDSELMGKIAAEMMFMQELAHAGKIAQGRVVARKRE